MAAEFAMAQQLGVAPAHGHMLSKRLPAVPSASAVAAVPSASAGIPSRPKFASAMSLNPDLHDALNEVFAEVFANPLRPDFAVAYIGSKFNLAETHKLITGRLGPGIPIITNQTSGLIGTDAQTNKLKEVIWKSDENNSNRGIVLSVGYVPGLKVDVIPLLRPNTGNYMTRRFFSTQLQQVTLVNYFVTEIAEFSYFASGYYAPACMMMFGVDMNQLLTKFDYIMPDQTAIVGDASASFMCTRGNESESYTSSLFSAAAAALVFARDQYKPEDIGETEFHVTVATGLMPVGPYFQTMTSALDKRTLRSSTYSDMDPFGGVICDCENVILDLKSQYNNPDIYIGVTKSREYSILSKPPTSTTSLSIHEVVNANENNLLVNGVEIKPGDPFLFYHSHTETALAAAHNARQNLKTLLADGEETRREVFGGFIFSSKNRGVSFFNKRGVDSKPFCRTFPGVPVAGMFGDGEIGRGALLGDDEEQELVYPRCCVHAYSSVYMAMSYVPPGHEDQMMLDE